MEEVFRENISTNIDENYDYLKQCLGESGDLVLRKFSFGKFQGLLAYFDGLTQKILLDNYVLEPLMLHGKDVDDVNKLKDRVMSVSDIAEKNSFEEGINSMLSGETLLFFEGLDKCYIIASRFWAARGVGEPLAEGSIRASRDSFVETIRFNTALVRRRVKDSRLKIVQKKVGTRSKTDVCIVYIDDIVDKDALDSINKKIDGISIDSVGEGSYIEFLIEDYPNSPFPQFKSTERPDVLVSAIFEGKIGVLVDNTPWALIAPTTLPSLYQSPDDYSLPYSVTTLLRVMRLIASCISVILPALYIALTSFGTFMIPRKLVNIIASTREGIPFNAVTEAFIMEFSIIILLEALTKLPKHLSTTIGIVGGLVIGQSIVNAGIASPVLLVVAAITTLTSFMTSNYGLISTIRILRFITMGMAAMFGFFGIIIGIINIVIHLCKIESLNVPYLAPAVDVEFGENMRDFIYKAHISKMKLRPNFMNIGDKTRQKE